jgi:Fe-S-cluster containining protein
MSADQTTAPRDQFPRTVCACDECRKPCEHMPGMLAPGDLGRIAQHLQELPDDILRLFRASPGAKVGRLVDGRIQTFRIPAIVPAQDNTGACVFLQPDGLCSIHPVAPFGCSHFDWHMDRTEGDQRSAACLRDIMADPGYKAKWHTLYAMGLVSEAPEAKRQAMSKNR